MEQLDECISSQIPVSTNSGIELVKIIGRKRDHRSKLVGTNHEIIALDSRIYTVKYSDGYFEQYSENILAVSLSSNTYINGHDVGRIDEICEYRIDSTLAVPRDNGYYISSNGNKVLKITTKGWELQVRRPDDSKILVPLKLFKNSLPILVAEFAKTNVY